MSLPRLWEKSHVVRADVLRAEEKMRANLRLNRFDVAALIWKMTDIPTAPYGVRGTCWWIAYPFVSRMDKERENIDEDSKRIAYLPLDKLYDPSNCWLDRFRHELLALIDWLQNPADQQVCRRVVFGEVNEDGSPVNKVQQAKRTASEAREKMSEFDVTQPIPQAGVNNRLSDFFAEEKT